MLLSKHGILNENPLKASKVALKVFFKIMVTWGVSEKKQMILIGQPSNFLFNQWQQGVVDILPNDTFERVSYIIGIYKTLHILFPETKQADGWISRPNSFFCGDSGLDFILKDSLTNLSYVRKYLDLQAVSDLGR